MASLLTGICFVLRAQSVDTRSGNSNMYINDNSRDKNVTLNYDYGDMCI